MSDTYPSMGDAVGAAMTHNARMAAETAADRRPSGRPPVTDTDRTAQIRARLEAISPNTTLAFTAGKSTLSATMPAKGPEEFHQFHDSMKDLVETFTEAKFHGRGVVIADDDEGQDLTFHLHAPADLRYLLDEVERLHSWDGLMSVLDEHWPEAIFPTVEDSEDRDWGPCIVSLLRWVDQSRTDYDEATQELATQLAEERTLTNQLAAAIARVREIPKAPWRDSAPIAAQARASGYNRALADVRAALDKEEV